MVHSPPHGERDRGRNASSEEGPANPSVISRMETKKGKGIVSPSDTLKYGEGSGGINKEETANQGTRRIWKCVLKSKTVPKL